MKRIIAITAATLMSTGLAGSALAQATGLDRGVGAGVETGAGAAGGTTVPGTPGATGATGATGAIGTPGVTATNLGGVISTINTGQFGVSDVEDASDISSVNVIRIDEMPGGDQQAALDEALDRQQDGLDDLRAAIEDNDEFYEALQDEDVSADDVVAVQSTGDGNFTVYVR